MAGKDKGFRGEIEGTCSDKPGTAPAGSGAELHTTGPAWKPGDSVADEGNIDNESKAPRGSGR